MPKKCNLQNLLVSINKETIKYGLNVIGQQDNHCSTNEFKSWNLIDIISL